MKQYSEDDLSLESLIGNLTEGPERTEELPGLSIERFTVHDTRDFLQTKAETYFLGIAADATGTVTVIPFGQAELDNAGKFNLRKVEQGEEVTFAGFGLPLLTSARGFIALRLLLADSDETARKASSSVKIASEVAGSKEAIALLVAGGMPQAAAVAFVLGKSLQAASAAMEAQRDDVIETFGGYFTSEHLVPGRTFEAGGRGATLIFKVG